MKLSYWSAIYPAVSLGQTGSVISGALLLCLFVFTNDKVFYLIWLYILFGSYIPPLWNTCACGRDVYFLVCKVDFVDQSDNVVADFSGTSRACTPRSHNFTATLRAL